MELLQIAMESVNSYFASNLCGCPDKEEEYKYTLALCEIIGCIADNDAGRQLLLKSGWELMEKFASVIFRIRCPPGEKFKQYAALFRIDLLMAQFLSQSNFKSSR